MSPAQKTVRQAVSQMLEKPAGDGLTIGYWLQNLLPRCFEQLKDEYNDEAAIPRLALADLLGIPELKKHQMGTGQFDVAFEKAKEKMTQKMEDGVHEHFTILSKLRGQFHEVEDLRAQVFDDLLPMLASLREGGPVRRLYVAKIGDTMKTLQSLSDMLLKEVPMRMQPDNAETVYKALKTDMTQVASLMYKESSPEAGESKTHYRNRLNDYWKRQK